jgi:hypothetical protein
VCVALSAVAVVGRSTSAAVSPSTNRIKRLIAPLLGCEGTAAARYIAWPGVREAAASSG